jgi:hypothetical protein
MLALLPRFLPRIATGEEPNTSGRSLKRTVVEAGASPAASSAISGENTGEVRRQLAGSRSSGGVGGGHDCCEYCCG